MNNSTGNNLVNPAEETLLKLADSINQYSASALSPIPISEFKGLPDEDIHNFLGKFKLATLPFRD